MDLSNAIEVRNMSKKFRIDVDRSKTLKEKIVFWKHKKPVYHEVLKNIDLNIKKGETVALIGINGSGKSTLLKLMTKIIFPTEGTLTTNGKLTSLLELGAGFHPDFTGRENIYFNASIFGLSKKEINSRIDEIVEFSELGRFIDDPIRTYSSGMYMRLAFSVAINVDAEILLIDEILAVGDQHFQEKCFAKLTELRDSGKTIVIVTHSLDVVKILCHRAIWLYNGKIRSDGDPTYVVSKYLEQVALDHKKEVEKSIESGKHITKGVVYIDTPKDLSKIKRDAETFRISGWQICENSNAIFELSIDGVKCDNIIKTERQDVYDAYYEDYGAFTDPKNCGFVFDAELKSLNIGSHKISAKLYEKNNKCIAEKEIQIFITE